MGTGTWTVTGTGTVFDLSGAGLTLTATTATVKTTDTSSTGKTINGASFTGFPSIWISAGSGTITFTNVTSCLNLDFTGFSGTGPTFPNTINGSLTIASGMTMPAGSATAITFAATSGTKTITSNGKIIDRPITIDATGGIYQLVDNLDIGTTTSRTLTLTNGTFDANNKNVTAGIFSSANSNTRTLTMGSGTWILNTTGTVWDTSTITGLTLTATTATLKTTDSSSTNKTISAGSLAGFPSIWISAGSGATGVTFTNVTNCIDFNLTGYTGTGPTFPATINGSLTLVSGMTMPAGSGTAITFAATSGTKTITSAGQTIDQPITIDAVGAIYQLADNLDIGTITNSRTLTLTNGTLDANGKNVTVGTFSSSNSNARTLTMGTGTWTLTGNNANVWNSLTSTNLTVNKGNPVVCNYSGSTGTRSIFNSSTVDGTKAIDFNITAGSDIVRFATSALAEEIGSVDFTGFSGTLTVNDYTIFGSLKFSSTMTVSSYTGFALTGLIFAATSGTKTITTNGKTIDAPVTFNGVGGAWQLADNLTVGSTRTVTLTNGTLDANNKNVTAGIFSSANSNTRTLTMGSGTWILSATGTVWDTSTITGLTLTATTATIKTTDSSATNKTITAGSLAGFPNIWISAGSSSITFTNVTNCGKLDFTGFSGTGPVFPNTINGNLTLVSGMTMPGGSATAITFAATSGTKTITSAGKTIDRPLTFDGVGVTWQLADALTVGATRTVTITNGTLDMGTNSNLTVGAVTIAAGGTLQNTGSGGLTLGGTLSSSGTVSFDAGGPSSSADTILIRSSVSGTQRAWSGSGTFTMIDVDVKDQSTAGGLWIYPVSSTDSGNNFGWFFGNGSATAILYLKLDDASGTTATDSSGNAFNGALNNGPTWDTTNHAPLSVSNPSALSFDGVDDNVQISNAALLNPDYGLTISVWVKASSVSSGILLAKWDTTGNNRQYKLELSGGKLVLTLSTDGTGTSLVTTTSSGSVTAGTWTHVAAVYNGKVASVFIAGTKTAGAASSNPVSIFTTGTASVLLGKDAQGTFCSGIIDEVKLFNIPLSDTDIGGLASSDTTPPGPPVGLTLTAGSDSTSIIATVTAPSDTDVSQLVWRYNAVDGSTSVSYPANSTAGTAFGSGLTTSVAPSSSNSKTATGLASLKTYGVAVWAKDAAGNVSTTSAQASIYLAPPTPRLVIANVDSNFAASAPAGASQTFSVTAKDSSSNTITNYAGPYTLTWTPTGGSVVTIVSSSTTGWSSGVATLAVTVGGADAGKGTFAATDNSTNGLTAGSLVYAWYPNTLAVSPAAAVITSGKPFTLTITAKDAVGAVVSRYGGNVNLSLTYGTPPSGTMKLSKLALIASDFVGGVAAVQTQYPDAGTVTITASDTTYVAGRTISGTSASTSFLPATFGVTLSPLPPRQSKLYVYQPFNVMVKALAYDGTTVTPNFAGQVTISGAGATTDMMTAYFSPLIDKGARLFTGMHAFTVGTMTMGAGSSGVVSGAAPPVGVRMGTLVINPASAMPGTIQTSAYVLDPATGNVVSDDDSTHFLLTLGSPTAGAAATSSSTSSPVQVSSGVATISVSKADAGEVSVSASMMGFPMPVTPAVLKWTTTGSTQTGTKLNTVQFEQQPGQTGQSFVAPTPAILQQAPSLQTLQQTSSFKQGGTAYDAGVSTGYTLVAPSSVSNFSTGSSGGMNSGSYSTGSSGYTSGSSYSKSNYLTGFVSGATTGGASTSAGAGGYAGSAGYSAAGPSGYAGSAGYSAAGPSGYAGSAGYSAAGPSGYAGSAGYSAAGPSGYAGSAGYSAAPAGSTSGPNYSTSLMGALGGNAYSTGPASYSTSTAPAGLPSGFAYSTGPASFMAGYSTSTAPTGLPSGANYSTGPASYGGNVNGNYAPASVNYSTGLTGALGGGAYSPAPDTSGPAAFAPLSAGALGGNFGGNFAPADFGMSSQSQGMPQQTVRNQSESQKQGQDERLNTPQQESK